MTDDLRHVPVLLNEAVEGIAAKSDSVLLDCTFGRGGHSKRLLEVLGPAGKLLAIDRDPQAIEVAEAIASEDARLIPIHTSFDELSEQVRSRGFEDIDGVLFDLGVSSPQLDDASRGFSFLKDGPLDMRMDPSKGVMAADWLAGVGERELIEVLKEYGEERYARRIARAIVATCAQRRIETTMQLADIVTTTVPTKERSKHPATRVFQALRIAVNDELGQLRHGLDAAVGLLRPGARIAVISFHSLEDRLVKRFFRAQANPDSGPFAVPLPDAVPVLKLIGKARKPSAEEIRVNPRSRSAILRIAEKCA